MIAMSDYRGKRPPRYMDLDPTNWEHQELARALKVQRDGPFCKHGHRWAVTGHLHPDGRVRCRTCNSDRVTRCRRKKRTMQQLSEGGI